MVRLLASLELNSWVRRALVQPTCAAHLCSPPVAWHAVMLARTSLKNESRQPGMGCLVAGTALRSPMQVLRCEVPPARAAMLPCCLLDTELGQQCLCN